MPEIGPMELLVCAVVALIVFGPEKLPDMARNVGRFLNDLRRMSTDVRSEVQDAFKPDPDTDDGFKPDAESETEASKADQLDERTGSSKTAEKAESPSAAAETSPDDGTSPADYPTRRPKTKASGDD